MVGVPTSKGCLLCLRRSVKCDEERPSCAQCRRGGRTCPGYVRQMKFVDEGPKVRRVTRTPAINDSSTSALGRIDKRRNHEQHNIASFHHGTRRQAFRLNQPSISNVERNQLLSSFISAMFPLGAASAQTSFLGSWLWHVPPRLGNSAALDHAASSVAWAYFAKLSADKAILRNAEISYIRAVKSLASALDYPKQRLGSNVLCATLLLGHYETFVNVNYAWIRHAGGAARLMQLRGAERCYESAFEYSMFLTCRGAIISEALASGTSCILDSKSWRNIPDGLIEFPLLPSSPEVYHQIFGYFAVIPGLQREIKLFTGDISSDTFHSLLSTAQRLRQDMRNWYGRYTSLDNGLRKPLAVSPVLKGYPFHSQYIYHDILSASIITTYYAYSIIHNQAITTLQPSAIGVTENVELASAICMAVDYCLHAGYCGIQTMRFSLPIAHSALPAQYHSWTNAWIDKFSAIQVATTIQPLHT